MAPANPGGGWDQTARLIQQVLSGQQIVPVPVEVINRAGAGGTIGLAELVARDDPHTVMVMGRVMLGAILTNQSAVSLEHTVPLARLLDEYEVIAVPPNSKYQTFQELIEDFRRQPDRISWGGGSAGGTDHILVAMIARAAGVDPTRINYVAYSGGGEAAVSVMGGHVTAGISGYAEWRPHAESGKMRFLAVSSETRLGADAPPTIRESGLDVAMSNWRAIVAPLGLDPERRTWLVEALSRMRTTAEWQEIVRRNDWVDSFLTGPELDAFIERETASNVEVLSAIGLVNIDEAAAQYAAVGPWVAPAVIIVVLLLSAAWMLLSVGAVYDRPGAHRAPLQMLPTGLLVLGYFLALNPVGYLPATTAYLFLQARLFGSTSWLRDGIFSVGTSILVYALFNYVLRIGLPAGVLG